MCVCVSLVRNVMYAISLLFHVQRRKKVHNSHSDDGYPTATPIMERKRAKNKRKIQFYADDVRCVQLNWVSIQFDPFVSLQKKLAQTAGAIDMLKRDWLGVRALERDANVSKSHESIELVFRKRILTTNQTNRNH